jgi:hypothetical protein
VVIAFPHWPDYHGTFFISQVAAPSMLRAVGPALSAQLKELCLMANCRLCGADLDLYEIGGAICASCSERLLLCRKSMGDCSFEELKRMGDAAITASKLIRKKAKHLRIIDEVGKKE